MKKTRRVVLHLIFILSFSFIFNFFWESLHGFALFMDHLIASDQYVRMMLYVSFMDGMTIIGMYLASAFFLKDIFWLKEMTLKQVIVFFVIGIAVAIIAEYWAVYVTDQWRYNNQMPVIFGIGLSPLFQLSVTGVLSVWLTKKVTEGK